ncbi:MAG: bis(5'-nucleosyl)-tetraphosphatase [Anaerolineae bacterium]
MADIILRYYSRIIGSDVKIIEEESFGIIPLYHQQGKWIVCLILHRSGNHWGFPKGHSQLKETPQQAAMRELKEETGLEVSQFLDVMPMIDSYHFRKKHCLVNKKVYYFPALVFGTFSLQHEEIREAKWIDLEQASSVLSFEGTKLICKKVQTLVQSLSQ